MTFGFKDSVGTYYPTISSVLAHMPKERTFTAAEDPLAAVRATLPPAPAPDHPEAFFDMHGRLRDWMTADPLPQDWTGIAVYNDKTFFWVGRENGERSFTVLSRETIGAARREAVALQSKVAVTVAVAA